MRRMIPAPPDDGKVYAIKHDEWVEVDPSGGIETVAWQDVENKPALYNKNEIDTMIGNIDAILNSILGV